MGENEVVEKEGGRGMREESGQEGRYYRAGSSSRSQAAKTQFR